MIKFNHETRKEIKDVISNVFGKNSSKHSVGVLETSVFYGFLYKRCPPSGQDGLMPQLPSGVSLLHC